ncbi:MAG TPA: hypothetical protein QF529_01610, partial [Candidatus Thalassarchaeaceae archaeon]|nr:hypothetical protein [Candidatus Thalassarchaeaceae archaeon]
MEALTTYLDQIEEAGTLAQIGFGLVASIVFTFIFRTIINGPVLKRIKSSENLYDDRVFVLATPIL